jgi:hypothetical protein
LAILLQVAARDIEFQLPPYSSKKMTADNCRQILKVEQSQEIDRSELAIDGGRSTDLRANR